MSDSEDTSAPQPPLGGKTLSTPQTQQPQPSQPYKSWRKKYRKMKHRFDALLDENKRLYRHDHLLSALVIRLREDLDGLLDVSLDINSSPSLPPHLRFDVRPQPPRRPPPIPVDPALTPETANQIASEYRAAVLDRSLPALDLHVVRAEMESALAAQGTMALESLERKVEPRPVFVGGAWDGDGEGEGGEALGYMTLEQEGEYLERIDRKLGDSALLRVVQTRGGVGGEEDEVTGGHFAELTPREQERRLELRNPSSQHNWLRTHTRVLAAATAGGLCGGGEDPDGGSVISGGGEVAGRKGGGLGSSRRKGTAGKNVLLVKQVGDRAVERAREEGVWSPGLGGGEEEDELSSVGAGDEAYHPGSRKKTAGERGKDGGGRTSTGVGGSVKGKRKRSGEDSGAPAAGGKKAKVEADL